MKETLLAWWSARQTREQQALLLGGGALAALLLYTLAILPLLERHQSLRDTLPRLRGSVAQLEEQATTALALRAQAAPAAAGGLPAGRVTAAGLEASARAAGVRDAMETFAVQPDGSLLITAARVSFDALLAWLNQIQAGGAVQVQVLDADAVDAPGLVRLKVQLSLAPPP